MESEQMYGDKGEVPDGEYTIPLELLISNVKVPMLQLYLWKIIKEAHIAADELKRISCEIVDLRTVRPMDYETILTSVRKTNRLVVLEKLGHLQVLLRDYLYCSRACF
jgi:pyruvate dehydrogenase E1 component beta subunit